MAPVFALEQVTVRRGGAVVLDAVTCEIPAGVCTAVAGRSGAGKSALLRLLNRLAEPTGGRVLLDGRPLAELDVLALRRRVGLAALTASRLAERALFDHAHRLRPIEPPASTAAMWQRLRPGRPQ